MDFCFFFFQPFSECSDDNPCEGLSRHATFDNFGMAFLTLFRVSTGDNWNGIMKVIFLKFPPNIGIISNFMNTVIVCGKRSRHATGQLLYILFCIFRLVHLGMRRSRIYCFNKREKTCMLRVRSCFWSFHIQNNTSFCWQSKELQHTVPHFWISPHRLYFNHCWLISVPFSSFSRTHCGSVALWTATASPTFPSSPLSTLSPSCSQLSSCLSMWSWPSSWSTWRTATRRRSWRRWRRKQRWERRRRPANASLRHLWVETWGRTWKHLRRWWKSHVSGCVRGSGMAWWQ